MDPFAFFDAHRHKTAADTALQAIGTAEASGDPAALAHATTEGLKAMIVSITAIADVLDRIKREATFARMRGPSDF